VGLGVGRAAGVEHQHRRARLGQQPAQLGATDQAQVWLDLGVFEHQVAPLARAPLAWVDGLGREAVGGQVHQLVQQPRRLLFGGLFRQGLEQPLHVEERAVAVKVDHVVGAARVPGGAQRPGQPLEGGRAQHV
jgi:hypothetical protein